MGNLFVFQGHSFDHFMHHCDAEPDEPFPNPPTHRAMGCPLCGRIVSFADFTEEHCPQRGGQSDFGGPACIVLTCSTCNSLTNELFEQKAGAVKHGQTAPEQNMGHISVRTGSDLWVVESMGDASVTYTNLKTAFLVAFSVLGYRFAFAHVLDPVRKAIITGDIESELDSAFGERPSAIGGPMSPTHLEQREPFTVLETHGAIVEVMADDFGWQFPVTDDLSQRTQQARTYSWPKTHNSGSRQQFMDHWRNGALFHLEHCDRPHDHPWADDSAAWTVFTQ